MNKIGFVILSVFLQSNVLSLSAQSDTLTFSNNGNTVYVIEHEIKLYSTDSACETDYYYSEVIPDSLASGLDNFLYEAGEGCYETLGDIVGYDETDSLRTYLKPLDMYSFVSRINCIKYNIISYYYSSCQYHYGAAHGTCNAEMYIYDLLTGSVITEDSIFLQDNRSQRVLDSILISKGEGISEENVEEVRQAMQLYLNCNDLIAFFNQYTLGYPSFEIVLDYEDIKSVLAPNEPLTRYFNSVNK